MANIFLTNEYRDIETALLLERAIRHDIGKAVAYTDGTKIFVNTDDNLFALLPNYNHNFLKWLLWHEEYHKELRHHNRFFKYVEDLKEEDLLDEFAVSKSEVNIIMDILVHDSLTKSFPELVETAIENLAQMRNRNSLGYTFTTTTLEEMLDEYKEYKHKPEDTEEDKSEDTEEDKSEDTEEDKPEKKTKEKSHGESKSTKEETKDTPEDGSKEETEEDTHEVDPSTPEPEHDKTDWSKLDNIDSKEFITKSESNRYTQQIEELRKKKLKLAKLTQTLNGLATTTRVRTYRTPSRITLDGDLVLKGSTPGRAQLYLCFDASGSMGSELRTFKEVISKSIPHAMEVPTTWFSGYAYEVKDSVMNKLKDPDGRSDDYFKGQFKDIMPVYASGGYSDDGDRTIELCWKAEQMGYSPIGVTDGGGRLGWSIKLLKQLKRTILVGPEEYKDWLEDCNKINPSVQIMSI